MERKIALVLGATGGIGGAVGRRLESSGWHVRALHRTPGSVATKHGFEWRAGDAMVASDVAAAAEGVSLIVHAVNPPGYRNWGKLVLPMLDNTIAAARANGAKILLPGTVYNYGPDAFPDIVEDAAQRPRTRKGRIRVEMEQRLRTFAETGAGTVLIVRAGDFFGPGRLPVSPEELPGLGPGPGRCAGGRSGWPDRSDDPRCLHRPSIRRLADVHSQGEPLVHQR